MLRWDQHSVGGAGPRAELTLDDKQALEGLGVILLEHGQDLQDGDSFTSPSRPTHQPQYGGSTAGHRLRPPPQNAAGGAGRWQGPALASSLRAMSQSKSLCHRVTEARPARGSGGSSPPRRCLWLVSRGASGPGPRSHTPSAPSRSSSPAGMGGRGGSGGTCPLQGPQEEGLPASPRDGLVPNSLIPPARALLV